VAFCDDDCLPIPAWLGHLVRRLAAEEDLGLLGGRVINIGFFGMQRHKGQTKLGRNGRLFFEADPKKTEFFGNMNLAFRREIVLAVGNYDPFFNMMAEVDLATRLRRQGFRIDYEPAAVLEHHNAGIFFKRRRFFFGPQLVRLYFYFKHYRPCTLKGWVSFAGYELKLMGLDFYRFLRALAAATVKGKFDRYPAIGTQLFNLLSARLAIPWLLWRTPVSQSQDHKLNQPAGQ
jgi:GT2 family glycosyltransferase